MRMAMLSLVASLMALTGCGGASESAGCTYTTSLQVLPFTAVADSSAAPPGNQQQFTSGTGETAVPHNGGSCAIPNVIEPARPVWTNPDPVHISISSATDDTNGLAICKGATAGAVTLTATIGAGTTAVSATAQLTCK